MTTPRLHLWYFSGTFVSGLLLFGGVGLLVLTGWPVVAEYLRPHIPYYPQLPLAQAREAPWYDLAAEQQQMRAPYPALSEVLDVRAGGWIHIPAIDVHVPLAESPSMVDTDVLRTLDRGAALYPNGVLPGRLGNVFIAAHSTGEPWKGTYRFAFLRVNELVEGNLIHLDYHGARYTYRIAKSETVTPSPGFVVASDRPLPTVTLMACWPLWSTRQRMLIHGELVHVTKLTPQPA